MVTMKAIYREQRIQRKREKESRKSNRKALWMLQQAIWRDFLSNRNIEMEERNATRTTLRK